ncbi:hypothetical protein CCHR01_03097 [Colletotrichum chrysophilum]|uniref:Uncharacterized protein n=1 Tax=Colletotrichum chrysophilum TaxID=1836956 RepID=A0AAD9AX29_9PEZI|nr:hypothetical protein CCHR01_03097 [Colletotrichum chrysophilum]
MAISVSSGMGRWSGSQHDSPGVLHRGVRQGRTQNTQASCCQ